MRSRGLPGPTPRPSIPAGRRPHSPTIVGTPDGGREAGLTVTAVRLRAGPELAGPSPERGCNRWVLARGGQPRGPRAPLPAWETPPRSPPGCHGDAVTPRPAEPAERPGRGAGRLAGRSGRRGRWLGRGWERSAQGRGAGVAQVSPVCAGRDHAGLPSRSRPRTCPLRPHTGLWRRPAPWVRGLQGSPALSEPQPLPVQEAPALACPGAGSLLKLEPRPPLSSDPEFGSLLLRRVLEQGRVQVDQPAFATAALLKPETGATVSCPE